jgi:hypothetical protein
MTEKPKFSPYLKYPIVDEKDLELALSKAYEQGKLDQSFSLRKKTLEKKVKARMDDGG